MIRTWRVASPGVLDLPAGSVEFSDVKGRQDEVVGEKNEGLAAPGIPVADAPWLVRTVGRAADADGSCGLAAEARSAVVEPGTEAAEPGAGCCL
jgi:hypothetical protein